MGRFNKQMPGNNPGYIYLFQLEDGGYKIGRSVTPSIRANELRWENGLRGELIWTLECFDMVTTERAIHQKLRPYHAYREVFSLPPEIIDWLFRQTEASACEGYDPTRYRRLK